MFIIYKTIHIPIKTDKETLDYLFQCNRVSAEVWNKCLKLSEEYSKNNSGKWIQKKDLQQQLKRNFPLHAKGIQHVMNKYLSARDAILKARKQGRLDVKFPYKTKKYCNTGWDSQSIKIDYQKSNIYLSKPNIILDGVNKRQSPLKFHVKTIPQNIVEIELVYKNKLMLAVKYKEENNLHQVKSNNSASIDLGEIHSIASIDNNQNAIIITGRKMRSIKQGRNKQQAKLREKLSKCIKGSRQYKKYRKAMLKLSNKTDCKILDCVHKITKLYVDFCIEKDISTVYYGDLDSCTRNVKLNSTTNQKLSQWNYGEIIKQLENKLSRYDIKLKKVKEYNTTKKCPSCGKSNKTKNRNYKCICGYKQHRDINGAINILNDNTGLNITKYEELKYLRIE